MLQTYRVAPNSLTIHADNGAPMRAHTVQHLLRQLGVCESHSRPLTANDNAHTEAMLKTLKYHHSFPHHFVDLEHANAWLRAVVTHYNHHHSALAFMTPAEVFDGKQALVQADRQRLLDLAFAQHPAQVFINKLNLL